MKAHPRTLDDLGWPILLKALSGFARTGPGAERVLGTTFLGDASEVAETYVAVAEILKVLASEPGPGIQGLLGIESILKHVERGGVGSAEALLEVMESARSVSEARRWVDIHKAALTTLSGELSDLPDLSLLAAELAETFDAHGQVREDASPELLEARRRSARLRQRAKSQLERYLKRSEVAEVLQDEFYTERDARYVVPVVSAFQGKIAGILHGTSASGQTVYVEPEDFIALNNELKVAEADVQAEERRVLAARSEWVAAEADALRLGFNLTVRLDTLHARAAFARRWDGAIPEVRRDGRLQLREARHPLLLLQGVTVVANDLELPPETSFVVVSGPNAGGKTVCLKTVGLLVLMAHAAIPLTAAKASVVPLFQGLHTVMGDAQSLEDNLSTFSGHLMRVHELLGDAGADGLVLMDELMVGTEPERGAALAIALLESLAEAGARGLVTTHFERLKVLALGDERFMNASVGIDPKRQAPTFRLQMGEAGTSSPFEVARELGFPPALLHRARDLMHGGTGVSEALERLESARAASQSMRDEAERARNRLEDEREGLAALEQELERRADEEVVRIQAETAAAAKDGLGRVRALVRELQQGGVSAQRVEAIRQELKVVEEEVESAPAIAAEALEPGVGGRLSAGQVDVGASVWIETLGRAGEVLGVARGGEQITVLAGAMKLTVRVDALRTMKGRPKAKDRSPRKRPRTGDEAPAREVTSDPTLDVPPNRTDANSVDIRGLRREDVAQQVEPLLDRAFLAEYEAVWIIHGHGTGVLREEVRAIVRHSAQVRRWRPGQRHEGGDGVTIAWVERP